MIMLIISAVLAVLYVGAAIWHGRKLPDSVSAMVYLLPRAGQWLWTLWLWAVAFLILPSLMEAMPESWTCVGFLTIAGLLFSGAMPLVKNEANTLHYVFAIAAGILSQVCVLLINPEWFGAWMLFLFLMGSPYVQPWGELGKTMKGKGVFTAECVCWLTLTGSLFTT